MTIPNSLQATLVQAKTQLKSHPKGSLRLGLRQLIWNELGPQEKRKEDMAVHTIGLKRRYHLARMCSQLVLPIFQKEFPKDKWAEKAIKMADDYLDGNVEERVALRCFSNVAGQHSAYHEQQPEKSYSIAGLGAAQKALEIVLFDSPYDANSIDPELKEFDVDNIEWDASYHAAESYANTHGTTPDDVISQRVKFWSWYLDEAVPAAWDSQPAD